MLGFDPRIPNQPVQIKGRRGVTTGKVKQSGTRTYVQVQFGPHEKSFIFVEDAERIDLTKPGVGDLLRANKFGHRGDLARVLTFHKISSRLANVFYAMQTSRTDFYAYQFKPVYKFIESANGRILIAGGLRSVVAESVLMRHQVLILNRGRKRAPNLRASDRIIAGLCTLLMRPARVLRSAVGSETSTLLHFHKMLIKQEYRLLFSTKRVRRPGPKGPTKELIDAVVEMKRRKRTWGCKRIAQQLTLAFGVDIDKDVVRRIPAIHFHPEAGSGGPSWLSFIGHAKDSLWSLDLLRCESAILRTYWVLVVMD